MTIDEDEYVSSFKVELIDAVVQWCKGASFTEICKVCPANYCHLERRVLIHAFVADGSVRGQPNPGVPAAAGTDTADVPGG